MTEHQRRRRLAKIRHLATASSRGGRSYQPELTAPEPRELELEVKAWRQAATNAGFAQRSGRYSAVGPRGRW